jgi:hypothetical protein
MKPLKFSILVEAIDSYIYSGHIFLILKDGDIAYSPISKIIWKLAYKYPEYNNLIRVAFQRNDYLTNTQGKMVFGINEIQNTFIDLWKKASDEIIFTIEFNKDDYDIISSVPTMPVLDMKLYAMRLYLGTKKGLYEINLNSDDKYHLKPTKPEERFGAKVTNINAKSGEIIISSNSEGLFHGTFLNEKKKLKVIEKPVLKKSLRTGWSGYDIVNYEEQNNFSYLVNKTEQLETKPKFSRFDEYSERKRISEFGISHFELSSLLEKSKIKQEDIKYCFNSSGSGFFFMNDGSFININLNKEKKENLYFTSRNHFLPNLEKKHRKNSKPISSSIVPKGCVIEYFDKIVLYQNSKAKVIEKYPSINMRSYPSSIRYRNLITVTKEKEISIHSIFPFEEIYNPITIEDFESDNIF